MRIERHPLALLLETIIRDAIPTSTCALLLSGGVDSLSLGFAATACGKQVHAYTFQLAQRPSADSHAAQRAAQLFGWPWTLIEVPLATLEEDFLLLATRWHCQKKTQFECTWPFLYVIPAITETYVLSGIAADGHFGLSKKAMIHARYPKAAFDAFRQAYFADPNPAGQAQQRALCDAYHKHQIAPYLDRCIYDYFLQFDHDQLNKPYQKMPTLRAYAAQFQQIGRRSHQNLQLVAGIDQAFKSLLHSRLNRRQRQRVMDLCHDYARR